MKTKARALICLVWFAIAVLLGGACSDPVSPAPSDGALSTDGGDAEVGPVAERKRIFHFRNGTIGTIGNSTDRRPALEDADEDCTNEASQMGLGGSWKAWLSSSQIDAIDRITDVSPWYRLDQTTLLFDTKSELTLGPRVRIDPTDASEDWDDCSRFGNCLFGFWSGTDANGQHTSDNCLDWTEHLGRIATVGRADVAAGGWVASKPLDCGAYLGLLCIEQ
jgi:hypothetical protein